MIHLEKGQKPAILERNGRAWTEALLKRLKAGEQPTEAEKNRYRHSDVKEALVTETHGKCAYCESKVLHVSYGDVEHIIPKSVEPAKRFEWINLTLACSVCNTNKGGHFGNHEDLVDPYLVEPNDHLRFVGALVLPVPGDQRGIVTERIIKLNRGHLMERRAERLKALSDLLNLIATAQDANVRAVLRRDIENVELALDKEFSATARAYVLSELQRLDQAAESNNDRG